MQYILWWAKLATVLRDDVMNLWITTTALFFVCCTLPPQGCFVLWLVWGVPTIFCTSKVKSNLNLKKKTQLQSIPPPKQTHIIMTTFLTVSDAAFFIEHVAIGLMTGKKVDEGGLALNKTANFPTYFWTVFMPVFALFGFLLEHHTDVAPSLYVLVQLFTVVNVSLWGRLWYVDYKSIDESHKTAAKICMSILFVNAIVMKALDMDGLPKDDLGSQLEHFNTVGFHVQHHLVHWTVVPGFVAVYMFPHTNTSPKSKVSKD